MSQAHAGFGRFGRNRLAAFLLLFLVLLFGVGTVSSHPYVIPTISITSVKAGETVTYQTAPDRHLYLVPASGRVTVKGRTIVARDGLALTGVDTVTIFATEESEIVMTDTR